MKNLFSNLKKRFWGSFIAVMAMLLITGCSAGSTIDSVLTINNDLSGTRKMNITISDSVFNEYFTGNIEDLNVLLEEACPDEMTFNYSETGGVKQYNMEISFSSQEDYLEKVTAILGEAPAELTITAPDTVWANGIFVQESFTDEQLLQWMKDVVVDNGFVSADNAGMIFTTGTVQVVYQDNTYTTGSQIYLDKMEYVSIDSINILTQVSGMDNYNRRVVIQLPTDTMDKKGDEIKEYLNNVVPANGSSEWGTNDAGTVFTVSADAMTVEDLEQFDKTVFASENCTVSGTDVSENYSPFSFNLHLKEQIDFSGFVAGNSASVRCSYLVMANDPYQATSSYDGLSVGSVGRESDTYSGFHILQEQYCTGQVYDFNTLVQKIYNVKSVEITTSQALVGSDWKRETQFLLEEIPEKEEQEAILAVLENKVNAVEENNPEAEAKKLDVSVSGKKADENYRITLVQKGTTEEIEESSKQLFGNSGQLAYAQDKGFWKIIKQEAFEERIGFGNLLTNKASDFKIEYTAKMGMMAKQQYCSDATAVMEGGKLKTIAYGDSVGINYVGTAIDMMSVLFWLLLLISGISVIVVVVQIIIIASKKENDKTAEAQPVPEEKQAENKKAETMQEKDAKAEESKTENTEAKDAEAENDETGEAKAEETKAEAAEGTKTEEE